MSDDISGQSAAPQPLGDSSVEMSCLAAMASQSWRLARLAVRAIEKLPPEDAARLASQLRYLDRQIDDEIQKAGMKVVNLEGQAFDAGIAATALNAEDFGPEDRLQVVQTLEPVVMGRSGLLRYGVVMLGRADT